MRWVHIAAGLLGIGSGAIALAALKGATLHRRSGMMFVYSTLVMSGTAVVLAALHQPHPGNIIAGSLTLYLVCTALLAVRRPGQHARRTDIVAMLAAWVLTFVCLGLGFFLDIDPRTPGGVPPRGFYFLMAALALFLALKDMRMIAVGGAQGPARLRRHLGRMGGAMFIATGSFFIGQPQVFAGGPLEWVGLRAIPVFAVVAVTLHWLVRLSRRTQYLHPPSIDIRKD